MRELFEELHCISDVNSSLELLRIQERNFIKKWDGKDDIPFMVADARSYDGVPPIIVFLQKKHALDAIEEKIRYNESELEKHKLAAVKIMQRLIEEWTSTR